MTRFSAILLLFSIRDLVVMAQDGGFTCDGLYSSATNCLIEKNLAYSEDYTAVNDVACTECFMNNNFFNNVAAYDSCDVATSDICSYFTTCSNVCYPKSNVCQQELYDFYVCVFGSALAPENCTVQCEGSSGNSNGSGNGKNTTNTSGVPMHAAITASSSILLLAMAGLLL
jgi:hypothetical protein